MRADARRNRDRLVSVASQVVAEQGAEASLEEIARRAGVGSATLHRHFASRLALLDAVFAERVGELTGLGAALLVADDPAEALTEWLRAVVRHVVRNRGLGTSLLRGTGESCHARILAAGEALVSRAAGTIRPDVSTEELLRLANGVALAAEEDEGLADRLLDLALTGLRPGAAQ
ncbi:TetR/AcrR family transcriptional regulator [Actinophytocola oryzae]|uniref:TetR family transcriptional regulator n=1 Tax=Actinophytocola oryzae TaxID=502181 RepID=A0A4R7VVL4_9PSEU|nr:TetR/AcrR family transcriptional regulator [Actinophytocola oryzae]TDV53665.1 TetR family transcriptional regulator [Actinophytocola oryzae]